MALQFGISVVPNWQEQDLLIDLVRAADDAGLDLVGIQDHPYQWRFHDTWTLIAYLAGLTERIRFFPDVVSLPLRPPAVLAKSVASLDVLTGGRVELGIGAGAFWDAIAAMGGPVRTPGEAFQATEEAIDIMRMVWSGERGLRYEGEFYSLNGMHSGPTPAHDIQIWVGARGPRMLDLIGRKADGWVPSSSWAQPGELAGYIEQIRSGAESVGRDPSEVRVVYNLMGTIGGAVTRWIDELSELVEMGVDTFVVWPEGEDRMDQVLRFANEVVPGVRSRPSPVGLGPDVSTTTARVGDAGMGLDPDGVWRHGGGASKP